MSHKTGIFSKKSIENSPLFWPTLVVSIFQILIFKLNENNLRFFFASFEFVKSVNRRFRNFKIRKIGKSESRKIGKSEIRKIGKSEVLISGNREFGKSERWKSEIRKIGKSENSKFWKLEIRKFEKSENRKFGKS